MPIAYFVILSIIFAITGVISIIIAFYYSKKSEMATIETDTITVTKLPSEMNQMRRAVSLFKIVALISLMIALSLLSTFMYYDATAKKYGAYDDYYKRDSIRDIQYSVSKGFIDQSKELPENLEGCIIIYVKYGCIDCDKIHDGITSYLKENKTDNIYFVSTKSEQGKKLLEKYPVSAVPTGVYILKNQNNDSNMYAEVIYDAYADETATDIFVPENLEKLINYQKQQS